MQLKSDIRNLLFQILPLMIGLLLNQVQACKSSKPRGWYIKVYQNQEKNRQDALLKEKEEIKTKTKERSQSLIEEHEQNLTRLSIEEEENVLEMTEEQEFPIGSGNIYQFIPANRNDPAAKTGQPKYLPVNTCNVY